MTSAATTGAPARRQSALPLTGIRILALEHFQAMPFATRLLRDLGADVVKVEAPGIGESARLSQPSMRDPTGKSVGGTFLRNGLGKRSLAIDWKSDAGARLIQRIVPKFDVFAENFRPGELDSRTLGFADLHRIHPSLVYVSISGFGHDPASPYFAWGALAPIAEAMAGLYQVQIDRGEAPQPNFAGPLGDSVPGLYAAIGLLAALRESDRTGVGRHVDIAMLDCMIAIRDYSLSNWSLGGQHGAVGLVEAFRASDGWCVFVAVRRHQFERLARLVGQDAWLTDPRFVTAQAWGQCAKDVIIPAIERWAATETRDSAAAKMAAAGIAVGPCLENHEIVESAHGQVRDMILRAHPFPDSDVLYVPGNPIKLDGSGPAAVEPPPALGEYTRQFLSEELRMSEDELRTLLADGVIGVSECEPNRARNVAAP